MRPELNLCYLDLDKASKYEVTLILLVLLSLLSYWPKTGPFIAHSYLFSRSTFCKFHG